MSRFFMGSFVPAGYWGIKRTPKDDWLEDERVKEIWSVSDCINGLENKNWINQWKHNGHWHYNSISDLKEAFRQAGVSEDYEIVYYEIYDQVFDDEKQIWIPLWQEDSFPTMVKAPMNAQYLGFDIVSFSARSTPECSPFSCNHVSTEVAINEFCLCDWDLPQMIEFMTNLKNAEPGPYKLYKVYKCSSVRASTVGSVVIKMKKWVWGSWS